MNTSTTNPDIKIIDRKTREFEIHIQLAGMRAAQGCVSPFLVQIGGPGHIPARAHLLVTAPVPSNASCPPPPYTLHGCQFGPDDIPTVIEALKQLGKGVFGG